MCLELRTLCLELILLNELAGTLLTNEVFAVEYQFTVAIQSIYTLPELPL